jgi:hypothetical protein
MHELVVTMPFKDYQRGDVISDPLEVAGVLRDYPTYVIRRQAVTKVEEA